MHSPWRLALLAALAVPTISMAGILVPKEPGAQPLVVRRQAIKVEVKDQVLRATLDETFENLTDRALEGTYQLPLPEGAAVSELATWVDGQRVVSHIQEKKAAEQEYARAQQAGQQPALLDKPEPGVFRTRIDGIRPHGTKRIEATFAQILPYDSGTVTLRLPLATLASTGTQSVGEFSFRAEISDQKKITAVETRSMPASIERLSPTAFRISFEGKAVVPARELVLTYRTEGSRLGLSFVTFKPGDGDDGYFLLLASPQELTTAADIVKKDVAFIFDTSGSMTGQKIDQARQALTRCLGLLNAEDRFGIIAFSDAMNPFRNGLVPASPENVQTAIRFTDGLSAGGGTNISDALLSGLKLLEGGDRPRVIVFMTDGQPSAGIIDQDAIARRVREKNQGATRLFTFGVGTDLNRTLLEQLAKENRGAEGFVDNNESIEKVVGAFYAKIAQPVLSDLSFNFGEVTTRMQYPDVLPDLYKGSQLAVVGRYRGDGAVKASLDGTLNGKRISIPFQAPFPKVATESPFIARLWAQRRIDYLMSQIRLHGERDELRTEVIALSEQFQILTSYTSLVVAPPEAVASISPQRVRPGDPVIRVPAPKNARAVKVSLPFGEVLNARWDEDAQAWTIRFLVPGGVADGSYPIRVDVEHSDGRRELLALRISIDTQAPALAVEAGSVRPGQLLMMRARASIGATEVLGALARRSDPNEAVKSLFDVKRVTARLWDGREVPLTLASGGLGFTARVETNGDLAPGRYPVVFTAQDFAGNTSRAQTEVEVMAP
jgi:uncharacterized protein YegL